MVRTNQPLVERMALIFHDWFATSNAKRLQSPADDRPVEPLPRPLLRLLPRPLRAVTVDPAMLQWLNGNENTKWAPNENYAREMMELFTLGADRGAYSRGRHPRSRPGR